jgi:hypothetical protein
MKCHIRLFQWIIVLTAMLVPAFAQAVEPDIYEEDNSPAKAKVIILNDTEFQRHNFHETGDEDWIKFYGLEGESYSIQADNVGADCDVVISLYDSDRVTFLEKGDDAGAGEADSLKCSPLIRDGIYYVKIHNISKTSGENTQYGLKLFRAYAAVVAMFQGSATDSISKAPLGNVMIRTDQSVTALSDENTGGNYTMYHSISDVVSQNPSDAYRLTARLPGYEIFTIPVFTSESCSGGKSCFKKFAVSDSTGQRTDPEIIEWDGVIELVPLKGDINGDLKADLADAVLGLQILAGIESENIRQDYIESHTDVSGDNKVGMEEVLHILNKIGTLKTDA